MAHLKTARSLSEEQLDADPMVQFQHWFAEAVQANVPEPNAMVLATVSPESLPSARAVLMKGFDGDGFRFFTNHMSRKGLHIASNQSVALVFLWLELERQVRVEGKAIRLSREDAVGYFNQRPRGSQLSAAISPQSHVVASRQYLESLKSAKANELRGKPVPMPDHWGGYVVRPDMIEFWQGRDDRLHDRIRYRQENWKWVAERLAP